MPPVLSGARVSVWALLLCWPAFALARILNPDVSALDRGISSWETHPFELESAGPGVVTVVSQRGAVMLTVTQDTSFSYDSQFQWAFVPAGTERVAVSTEGVPEGTTYQIRFDAIDEGMDDEHPLILTTLAAELSEEDGASRKQAIVLNARALARWEAGAWPEHEFMTRMRQAELLRRELRFADAEVMLQQALAHPEGRSHEALIWNQLGALYDAQDRAVDAQQAFCNSISAEARTPFSDCTLDIVAQADFRDAYWPGRSSTFLGLIEHYRGNLTLAASWYRLALQLLPEWSEESRELVTNNLGGVALMQGDHRASLAAFDTVRRQAAERGNDHRQALALGNLAATHMAMGEADEAIRLFRQSLDYRRDEEDIPDIAHIQYQIGSMYLALGNLQAAGDFLEQSYRTRSAHGLSGSAQSLLQLGKLRREEGKVSEAVQLHAQARSEFEQLADVDGQFEAVLELVRDRLASSDFETGERLLAQATGLEPVVEDERLKGPYHFLRGLLALSVGEAAEPHFRKALNQAERVDDHNLQIDCWYQIAVVRLADEEPGEALDALNTAIALIEAARLDVSNHSLRASYTGGRIRVYDLKVDVLNSSGRIEDALEFALGNRTRVLAESLTVTSEAADSDLERMAYTLRTSLAARTDGRRRIAERWPGSPELEKLDLEIADLINELDAVESQLLTGRIGDLRAPTVDTLKNSLSSGDLLIVHWLGETRSWRWEVDASDVVTHAIPSRRALLPLIRDLRQEVTGARRRQPDTAAMTAVLLGERRLSDYTHVSIIPDSETMLVPWAALTNSEGPVVGQVSVTVVPGALLPVTSAAREGAPRAIVLADPVYGRGDARGSDRMPESAFTRLVHSGKEADSVSDTLAQRGFEVKDLRGFDASKQSLMDLALNEASIIHLAAHGVSSVRYPQNSGLQLTSVTRAGEPQTGLLSLSEIYDLDITADLVVLSACDTAVGEEIAGEGPISLARAFMVGGARQVVASLWPVDDVATRELMTRFYDAWTGGMPTAAALARAQSELATQARFRGPRYWGAFVLVAAGETNPPPEAGSKRDLPKQS